RFFQGDGLAGRHRSVTPTVCSQRDATTYYRVCRGSTRHAMLVSAMLAGGDAATSPTGNERLAARPAREGRHASICGVFTRVRAAASATADATRRKITPLTQTPAT